MRPLPAFSGSSPVGTGLGKARFSAGNGFSAFSSGPDRQIFFCPPKLYLKPEGLSSIRKAGFNGRQPVYHGGTPVEQLSAGGHPPRIFREDIPGGEPRPAGWILAELARLLSPGRDLSLNTLWSALAEENPIFSRLQSPTDSRDEIRIVPDQGRDQGEGGAFPMAGSGIPEKNTDPGDSLELLLVDRTFGTEEMSSYSSSLRETAGNPSLILPAEVGGRLGFRNRDTAVISLDGGPVGNSVGSPGTSGGGGHGPAAAGPTGLAKNSRLSGKAVSGSNKKKPGDPVTPDWILGYLFLLIKLSLVLIALLSSRRLPDPGRTETAGADAGPLRS